MGYANITLRIPLVPLGLHFHKGLIDFVLDF